MTNEVSRLLEVVAIIREVDSELPIQTVHTFLLIAQNPGITAVDIAARSGLTRASASRNVRRLSRKHKGNPKGLNLVIARENAEDSREKLLHVSPFGTKILERLRKAVH